MKAVTCCGTQVDFPAPQGDGQDHLPFLPSPIHRSSPCPQDITIDETLDEYLDGSTNQGSLFQPSLGESFIRDETEPKKAPQDERKFIVFESALLELFNYCRTCYARCESTTSTDGTSLKVTTLCCVGHKNTWNSQPVINSKPAGNVLLSAAILFSGESPTGILRMLSSLNIQVICIRTFHNHQRAYLQPAVHQVCLA